MRGTHLGSLRRGVVAAAGAVAAVAAVLAAAPPASAKQGPISIRSVWIGDGQHTQRTVLNSGDKATYHIDVDNTTGETMSVEVSFEVFDIDGPSSYSYNYTGHNIAMPAGLSRFYSPSTLPIDATTGTYMARISIWPTASASPVNEGDISEADFRVFSLSASPVNDAIENLQHGALCAGGVVSLGWGSLFVEYVKTGADAIGYFKDVKTGNVYWALVNLTPVGTVRDCVSAITGAGTLFHAYQLVLR